MKLLLRVCTDATQERGVASMVVLQQRWRAQSAMLRAVRTGDLPLLVRLLDSDLGLDCDMAFSIGGAERPAICLALEQVGVDNV